MTPAVFRSFADRFYRFRWYFLTASLACFGVLACLIVTAPKASQAASWLVGLRFGLLVPIGLLFWGLLCACIWFHPTHGNLESKKGHLGRLPAWLRSGIRWYAAIFLVIWFFVACILWPAQSARLFL
jgi:hypothetical protein